MLITFVRYLIALAWTIYLCILLVQPEQQPLIPTTLPPGPPSFERELLS